MIGLAGKPYRPSNSTEGDIFDMDWCAKCFKDRAHRESEGEKDGCPIIAKAMAYRMDEPGYPSEWVYGAGNEPTCTAFDDKPPLSEADKKYLAWKAERTKQTTERDVA